ncbi:MAG TPA: hypothetical protein VF468_19540 [Actinomycetota bacterium]|nr:hypothetical protein [Actinomycetota bacterium]
MGREPAGPEPGHPVDLAPRGPEGGGPTLPGWVGRRVGVLVGVVLALLALGPLLVRGYVLTYDMVFVPRLDLTRGLLGLDTAVARAVPADLLVALASRLVPADLVQKLLLAGVFVGAAAGAARLVPSPAPLARVAAAALYAWNPFLYERLIMGHWGLLVSYAALPWVARAAIDLRAGRPGVLRRLVLTLAVAAAGSPAGGLIAAAIALCVAAAPRWPRAGAGSGPGAGSGAGWAGSGRKAGSGRGSGPGPEAVESGAVDSRGNPIAGSATLPLRGAEPRVAGLEAAPRPWPASPPQPGSRPLPGIGIVAVVGLLMNLPWLVPSLLRPGGVPVRPEGVEAFAARPDGPLGTVGSLVGLGGIWNALAVPPGVGTWPWLAGLAVVLGVAGAGLPLLWRRWPPGVAVGLLVAAGAGLVLAAAPAVPGLRALVELVVTELPGGGLVRDSHKFVAPLAVVEAVCFGLGVERLLPALPVRWARPAAVGLVAAPVLLLPALAWGGAGRLAAVDYPPAFAEARAAMAADPAPGAVLVLPWHLYQPFAWNGDRVVLDPAQRWFTRRAVGNDDLELVGLTVPGEDPHGSRLGPLVRGTAPLAPPALPGAGIRYVLVFKEGDWRAWTARLDGLVPALDRPELALYRVPGRPAEVRFPTPPAAPVVAADLLAVAVLIGVCAGPTLPFRPRRLVSSARHRQGGPE